MTAHVSAVPNHQIKRVTPFHTRALVAMSASFGYEMNPLSLSEGERAAMAEQTAFYRRINDLVAAGDFYRLAGPFEENAAGTDDAAWMFVSPDRNRAFAVYVRRLTTPAGPARVIKLQGLDPDAVYHIDELDGDFGGDELMYAGVATPYFMADFEALSFTLTRKA